MDMMLELVGWQRWIVALGGRRHRWKGGVMFSRIPFTSLCDASSWVVSRWMLSSCDGHCVARVERWAVSVFFC